MLSTLHAANALEAVVRLRQVGVAPELLASAVKLFISLRLVGLNCPICSVEEAPTDALAEALQLDARKPLRRGTGCTSCDGTGMLGRLGVFEFLRVTDLLRTEFGIRGEAALDIGQLRALARDAGYVSYAVDVRRLLIAGEIGPTAVLRALGLAPSLLGYPDV